MRSPGGSSWGGDQRNFDNIIAAVEQYKAAENHYPGSLDQLVPKYLAAIPDARSGKFLYSAYPAEPDDAHLSRRREAYLHESYSFKSKLRNTWD